MAGSGAAADYIKTRLSKNGIILLLGAGCIDTVADILFKR